jgi:Tfp pilus assembly protein PilV
MEISKFFDKSFKKACPSSMMVGSRRGSMMVEVLIVAFIITISVLSALAVAEKAIYLSRHAVHQSQASFLLDEGAEATRVMRDGSWNNISSLSISTDYYLVFTGGTWTLSTTPSQIGIFTRKVVFSSSYRDVNQDLVSSGTLDGQVRLVDVTISWDEGGQPVSKTLQFYLMDLFS